jgi:hypothetical protein
MLALAIAGLVCSVVSSCVPDVPKKLLWDPAVLQHPAVALAFQKAEHSLKTLFISNTRDGLSFAIVSLSLNCDTIFHSNILL